MVSFILPGNSATGGYEVANSLRFNDGSSDYLDKTPSADGSRVKWTWSGWVKRCSLGHQPIFSTPGNSGNIYDEFYFNSTDKIQYSAVVSGTQYALRTKRQFRDFGAWYNIILIFDSNNSTASDRMQLWINGVRTAEDDMEDTTFKDAQNYNSATNKSGYVTYLGRVTTNTAAYFDGYMAEVVFQNDNADSPVDKFGEFDSDSPTIWKPKNVSGLTFGTNGFYLDFEDSSALGNDAAGSNNFSVNNLTAVDQCTDTCTNNFATFNGNLSYNSTIALAEGNLKGTTGSTHEARTQSIFSSIGVTQGKWYAEFKVTTNSNHSLVGISADMESDADGSSGSAYSFIYLGQGLGYYGSNGKIFHTNSDTQMTYGSAVSNNDIIGVALDADNQEVYFSINGTFQNSGNPASGSSKTGGVVNEGARNIFSTGTGTLFFVVADHDRDATCAIEANFGGGSVSSISSGNSDANGYGNFEYSVPSGYYSLCTKNLAEYG